jgi:alkylresorcinol/alkylpyrone synthase
MVGVSAPTSILSIGTALPQHRIEIGDVVELAEKLWPRLATVAKATGEGSPTRYFVSSLEEIVSTRTLGQSMATYADHARRLLTEAICKALESAHVRPQEIDFVISVSCTGYLIPSVDALLVGDLGLRPDVIRLPITELGCSAGAAAIAFAHRHLLAHPDHKVLVAAVELPSVIRQREDHSLDNLIATLVFGDGAAAAVLGSGGGAGLRVEAAASYLVPDTAAYLGMDLRDSGFHVVLSPRLPRVVQAHLEPAVSAFMEAADVRAVDFLALHAGGPRIVDAVQAALGLSHDLLDDTRRTFERVGNLSSASILFVLQALASRLNSTPHEGLAIGLGPGVSVELLHLRWCPAPAPPR